MAELQRRARVSWVDQAAAEVLVAEVLVVQAVPEKLSRAVPVATDRRTLGQIPAVAVAVVQVQVGRRRLARRHQLPGPVVVANRRRSADLQPHARAAVAVGHVSLAVQFSEAWQARAGAGKGTVAIRGRRRVARIPVVVAVVLGKPLRGVQWLAVMPVEVVS